MNLDCASYFPIPSLLLLVLFLFLFTPHSSLLTPHPSQPITQNGLTTIRYNNIIIITA